MMGSEKRDINRIHQEEGDEGVRRHLSSFKLFEPGTRNPNSEQEKHAGVGGEPSSSPSRERPNGNGYANGDGPAIKIKKQRNTKTASETKADPHTGGEEIDPDLENNFNDAFNDAFDDMAEQTDADEANPQARNVNEVLGKFSSKPLQERDFLFHMPSGNFIFLKTRDLVPKKSVDARVPPRVFKGEDGKDNKVPASSLIAKHRAVAQMSWFPGEPAIVRDTAVLDAGRLRQPGSDVFNRYRPAKHRRGDPKKGEKWTKHLEQIYPEDADGIITRFAFKVQHPSVKINHGMVLGGRPGSGKDTGIAGVRHAIGVHNFKDTSPQKMMEGLDRLPREPHPARERGEGPRGEEPL
jgi:hypothetical protein